MRRLFRAFLVLVILGSLLATAHVARSVLPGTRSTDVVARQVAWLAHVAPDAAKQMQRLFPEGALFTWALTGLAAGNLARAGVDVDTHLAVVDDAVAAVNTDEIKLLFGENPLLPHGVFFHGWRLLLLVDQATITQDETQLAEVQREAELILTALDADPMPTSYPGQAWPCDVVVALAAVHRASVLVDVVGLDQATATWFEASQDYRDSSGLLVHQVGSDRARGSSQSIIQAFLPDIDPEVAAREWTVFRDQFLTEELGLVGTREHPHGITAPGDVDSGPLIRDVSASASAVTLAAAKAQGDLELATVLDREADLLGLPLPLPSGRAFALGQMPVGDAFVTWARSVEPAQPTNIAAPQPAWFIFWTIALLPGLAAGALLLRTASRTKPTTGEN